MPQSILVPHAHHTGHWGLLRVIPNFLVGNEVAPFDVQDLPNASSVKDDVKLL